MSTNISSVTAPVMILIVFFSIASLHCGSSSCPCPRSIYDQRNANEMSGCYYLVAQVGGIIGRFREAHDEHRWIVLTPDSLFNQYKDDTLDRSTKFDFTWKNERDGIRTAVFHFDEPANLENLAVSWRRDTMWVGPAKMFPDAQWNIYKKCFR